MIYRAWISGALAAIALTGFQQAQYHLTWSVAFDACLAAGMLWGAFHERHTPQHNEGQKDAG